MIPGLGRSPGGEDPLVENMASHSSTLGWRIPWTKEADGLQSISLQSVGQNWNRLCTHVHTHKEYYSTIQRNKALILATVYCKWKKADTNNHVLYDTCGRDKSIETESIFENTRGEGNKELLLIWVWRLMRAVVIQHCE